MNTKSLITTALAAFALSSTAKAAIVINLSESGSDLVATVSGSFDLSATLGYFSTSKGRNFIVPSFAGSSYIAFHETSIDVYNLNTAPNTFGTAGIIFGVWSNLTGTLPGFYSNPAIGVPRGYTSGSPLSGSATIIGGSYAAYGLTPGSSFTTVFTNGNFSDSLTVEIGLSSVIPEPSTYIAGAGLIGLAGFVWMHRRRRNADSVGDSTNSVA